VAKTGSSDRQSSSPQQSDRGQIAIPSLEWESVFWNCGIPHVAGVDEVGRGAMAGPLVAAAVVLPAERRDHISEVLSGVRDSKLLTHQRRVAVLEEIKEVASSIGVGIVPVDELDSMGLGAANRIAMERAVLQLDVSADALLVDACVIDLGLPQLGPIDGDALSLSIAAASIVAKVTRDRMMIELAAEEERYGFEIHKGYCSPLHKARLAEHGPSIHHRQCFSPVAAWGRSA
jgi:ribonuclease HII